MSAPEDSGYKPPRSPVFWGNFAQWISACAALITLGFAWRIVEQVELNQQMAELQVWQMVVRPQGEISRELIAHPELMPYFSESKPLPERNNADNEKAYFRVMALADMYLDWIEGFQDTMVDNMPGMRKGQENRVLWEKTFKRLFETSPALCSRLRASHDLYRSRIKEHARDGGCLIPT